MAARRHPQVMRRVRPWRRLRLVLSQPVVAARMACVSSLHRPRRRQYHAGRRRPRMRHQPRPTVARLYRHGWHGGGQVLVNRWGTGANVLFRCCGVPHR